MDKVQLAIQAERDRMGGLALADTQKKVLVEAANYVAVPFLPQSKEFIKTYIISGVEFPTPESRLVQALTELQARMNNLAQASFDLKKMELQMERHEIDKEQHVADADEHAGDPDGALRARHSAVSVKEADLEILNIRYRIAQTHARMDQMYTELKNWKEVVDETMAALGVASPHEIDYTKTKMAEMDAKIRIWRKLHTQHNTEITPSQLQVILANPGAWNQASIDEHGR